MGMRRQKGAVWKVLFAETALNGTSSVDGPLLHMPFCVVSAPMI
jgi:hypothetical protein